jgi:hypothetical protein
MSDDLANMVAAYNVARGDARKQCKADLLQHLRDSRQRDIWNLESRAILARRDPNCGIKFSAVKERL